MTLEEQLVEMTKLFIEEQNRRLDAVIEITRLKAKIEELQDL